MEHLAEFIFQHVHLAPYIIFGLLMLAGLNFPISEDFMLILSGMLASTVVPEQGVELFVWTFLGCYLSDWEAYWMGRSLGPRLFQIAWFRGRDTRKKIQRIRVFYRKYGVWTLLVGRFIPFGVRNCLFMTAGLGRMSFPRFLLADGVACLVSNTVLFSLAYGFGKNYEWLHQLVSVFNIALFFLAAVGVGAMVGVSKIRRARALQT